jgi:type II secretory pathway component PulK
LDSTLDVGIENHKAILELLANFTVEMKMIGEENPFNMNKLALAQFTPELKLEFGFNELSNEISKINGMAEEENVDELIRRRILVRLLLNYLK